VLAIWDFSTGYEWMGILHILAVIAAFGPLLVYPTLHRAGDTSAMARLHMRISLPALVIVWVLGMGMVGMSEDTWEMSQTWIVLSLLGWVVLMLVSWFLIRPAIADTGDEARRKLGMGTGITHLLMVAIVILMVLKPGAPDGF
jgi:uncharacterized membrane protein